METSHTICFADARRMKKVADQSVDLVVTSPPYPMIEMWDEHFARQTPKIRKALQARDDWGAFEAMHRVLDAVWNEAYRVLRWGGLVCINIGDATRKLNDHFGLYPNHARILTYLMRLGLNPLPEILWRKPTNAPNKFMGSGMMPPGAYVTLEHEHILILRKGGLRQFDAADEKRNRRSSAFFWEERNIWYSDIWQGLIGTVQKMNKGNDPRLRSGAFPFEVPYRLINMFSVKGDTILDPFLGTGTSMLAAMASGRNSIGYELERGFRTPIWARVQDALDFANSRIETRINAHLNFVAARREAGKNLRYTNCHYHFPVVTRQEQELLLNPLLSIAESGKNAFKVRYSEQPHTTCSDNVTGAPDSDPAPSTRATPPAKRPSAPRQLTLLD